MEKKGGGGGSGGSGRKKVGKGICLVVCEEEGDWGRKCGGK